MWLIARISPVLNSNLFTYFSFFFFIVACLIGFVAVVHLFKRRTTIHPHEPEKTSSLVTSGIYGFTRNPMYLGLFFFLIAWGFYLSNIPSFFICVIFVLYITRFQIKPEEKALERIFGDDFIQYKNKVRRWL